MTSKQFSSLKVGDSVRVLEALPGYYRSASFDASFNVIAAGRIGVVSAVNVPSTRRENVCFCCVDFPDTPQERNSWSSERIDLVQRVGALPCQIELSAPAVSPLQEWEFESEVMGGGDQAQVTGVMAL